MSRHILDRNRRNAALLLAGFFALIVLVSNGVYLDRNGTLAFEVSDTQDELTPLRDSLVRLGVEKRELDSGNRKLAQDTLTFREQIQELEAAIPQLKEEVQFLQREIMILRARKN